MTQLYEPLRSLRTIRLATLDQSSSASADQLTIRLQQFDLDQLPPWSAYVALSYVWGQNPALTEVKCATGRLKITTNLHNALKGIWQATPSEPVWADALCINQTDNVEKSNQVRIMAEIYQRASSTVIWLGTAAEHFNQRKPQHFIHGLLSSDWLCRMWTLQEVVLASKPIVMYGNQWMEWRELAKLVTSTQRKENSDNTLRSAIQFIEMYRLQMSMPPTLSNRDNKILGSQKIDLTDVILETRARSCRDGHDKIYALLSVFSSKSYYFSVVNYDSPIWTAFAEATAMSVMFDHKMHLLNCSGLVQSTSTDADWPSWVPDLASTRLLNSAKDVASRLSTQIIAWPQPAKTSHFDFESRHPRIMKVRAWVLGIILRDNSSATLHPPYVQNPELCTSSACDELVELPSCARLDHRLILNSTSSTSIGVYSPKKWKTLLAKDILPIVEAHNQHKCSCPTSVRESQIMSTRPQSDYHPSMRVICLLDHWFRSEVHSWDWVCEIPINGGLCILRPTSSGQFQLLGTSVAFHSFADQLKSQLEYVLEELKHGTDDFPTAFMNFEIL